MNYFQIIDTKVHMFEQEIQTQFYINPPTNYLEYAAVEQVHQLEFEKLKKKIDGISISEITSNQSTILE